MEKPNQAIVEVVIIALAMMMLVNLCGAWYDSYLPRRTHAVSCSAQIVSMVNKVIHEFTGECQTND